MALARTIVMFLCASVFYALLADLRWERKKAAPFLALGTLALAGANILLALWLPTGWFGIVYVFTGQLALAGLYAAAARQRGLQMVYLFLFVLYLCAVAGIVGMAVSLPFGQSLLVDMLVRLAAVALLCWPVWRYFRPSFHEMCREMERGWGLLCCAPLAYYACTVLLLNRVSTARWAESLAVLVACTVLMGAAYVMIFRFFQQLQNRAQMERERQLFEVQAAALRRQAEAAWANEAELAQVRHDMRAYIRGIDAMLREGRTQEALRFVGGYDEKILSTKRRRWCENVVLNAVLDSYLTQAEREGVTVEARLDIPQALDTDAVELSTVFCNAIENALNACRAQPPGQPRRLELTAVSQPQFAVEIANTFSGQVRFGPDGLPVTDRPGHGFGTRSIAAYAQKHGAAFHYKVKGGLLRLYLLLNAAPAQDGDGEKN